MGQQDIQGDRENDGSQRASPTAPHGVGHGDTHRGGRGNSVALKILKEAFEIVDGNAPTRTAAGHSGEVGGMETEFGHTCLHAGREETGSARVGWHGQTTHGGSHFFLGGAGLLLAGGISLLGLLLGRRGRRVMETESLGIRIADFQITECRPDCITLADNSGDFAKDSAAGDGNTHDRFVGLDLQQIRVGLYPVADREGRTDDGGFGDRLAELGHDDGEKVGRFG